MKNTIQDAKESVTLFFKGNFHSYEEIYPVRTFLKLNILGMGLLGVEEINEKHKGVYSHFAIENKDESEMIIFIHDHALNGGQKTISMYCVKENTIMEYRDHNQKSLFTMNEFDDYTGLNMLAIAKKFCEGIVEKDLTPSTNTLAFDIFKYINMLAQKVH
ncbi:MAG: hypothetical protein WC795_00380 [Candidatus Paceibacterota bacterium]|jgi:hypothetical protein